MKQLFLIRSASSGFTMIELLIVIAVLGVLAAVVLVAIDPLEQLARGRDAGRKSAIAQLGHALQAYFTAHSSSYPAVTTNWITDTLVASGEIKTTPANVSFSGSIACPTGTSSPQGSGENGLCYSRSNIGGVTEAVIYAQLESKTERLKCGSSFANAYYTFASVVGRTGIICVTPVDGNTLATDPAMAMVE
jgi:prepilin-type N-terminal cleavage/methylation domain-containing protein